MPRRGENITKRKDGRWEVRIIIGHTPTGKAMYRYLYAKSYTEARTIKQVAAAEQISGATFVTVAEQFLNNCRYRVKQSTLARYRETIIRHIAPAFAHISLQNLTGSAIERFAAAKLADGLSVKTVRDILSVIAQIIRSAENSCLLPAGRVRFALPKVRRREIRILTRQEQDTLLTFSLANGCRAIGIALSLMTGLRIGELCALRWSDVDFTDNVICVRRTVLRISDPENTTYRTRILMGAPKSAAGVRIVPVASFLIAVLRRLCRASVPDGYILTGTDKFIEPTNYYAAYRRWLKALGIAPRPFHTLRHTFATRCVENGMDVKSLSEILGHTSVAFTMNCYVHPSLDNKRAQIERLAAVYSKSFKPSPP